MMMIVMMMIDGADALRRMMHTHTHTDHQHQHALH